jgi:Flp pilus assembly protein TadG
MLLSRFWQDRDGNVALIFAALFIPIIAMIGAAIDYSRAASTRAEMQAALDATALMLSKVAPGLSSGEVQNLALSYFLAQFSRKDATVGTVTGAYKNQGGDQSVTVTATATMGTDVMRVVNSALGLADPKLATMDIGSSSTVKWGNTKLRVAMALDNTGSMLEAGKIDALKTASKALLKQLQDAAVNPGDIQVSIVPFNKDVNVGAPSPSDANWKSPVWIDWSDWDADNGHDASTQTCTSTSKGKNGKTQKKCTTSTGWVPNDHKTWNGCVTDRDQGYDVLNTAANPSDAALPATTASTLFPAEQYPWCPVSMMGLSNDWLALNAKIDSMYATGYTNQTIGLAWAWQTLTQGQPMNASGLPADTAQFIILLTDGMNTENRVSDVQSEIDMRTKLACDNIKAAGKGTKAEIKIFTILVMAGNSSILQDCATDKSMYFALSSAGQLVSTFNQIGTSLANLRIAK